MAIKKRARRQIGENIKRLEGDKNRLMEMCGIVLRMVFDVVLNLDDRLDAVEKRLGMTVEPYGGSGKEDSDG